MKAAVLCMSGMLMGVLASAAWGQQAPTKDALEADASKAALVKLKDGVAVGDLLKSLVVDMPVTTPPATFVLGAAGTVVPRVSTFREFGAQLSNAVGDDGKIKNAVAVEINPRLAMGPVKWNDYRDDIPLQILTRTTLSVATLTRDGETGARSAIGLQSVLYSAEVAKLIDAASTGDCVETAKLFIDDKSVPKGPLVPGQPLIDLSEKAAKAHANCKANIEGLLTKWNPTSITLGLGQAFYSDDGAARMLKSTAGGVWITATAGYDLDTLESAPSKTAKERRGIGLTLHLRRMLDERVADPTDASAIYSEKSNLLGLNVRAGNGKTGLLLEYSARKSKAAPLVDETRKRAFLGLEHQLQKDLYLVLGVGSDSGRRDGEDRRTTLVNLKWGFSGDSLLK